MAVPLRPAVAASIPQDGGAGGQPHRVRGWVVLFFAEEEKNIKKKLLIHVVRLRKPTRTHRHRCNEKTRAVTAIPTKVARSTLNHPPKLGCKMEASLTVQSVGSRKPKFFDVDEYTLLFLFF